MTTKERKTREKSFIPSDRRYFCFAIVRGVRFRFYVRSRRKAFGAARAFTFNEFANFIRDWRKYKHWINEGKNRYKAVAYLGVAPSSDYPPEIVRWCDEHGWAVDRFFLMERKMRSGLTAAQQEEKRTVMVKQLKAQIAGLKQDKTMQAEQRAERENELYAQMQKVMNTTVYKAPISPAEFEMIKFNKTAVESTMRD